MGVYWLFHTTTPHFLFPMDGMATGACGINCSTCRLHLRGICSSCGPATGQLAEMKLLAQEKQLGSPCPILACARMNRLDHCLADCDQFPCENLSAGPYPFSRAFIDMQDRRRRELGRHEEGGRLPPEHWQALKGRDPMELMQLCGATSQDEGRLILTVFNQEVRVQPARTLVETRTDSGWCRAEELLSLVVVVYLAHGRNVPLAGRWVDTHQLGCSSFFQGRYALRLDRLLSLFGDAPAEFIAQALRLGGTPTGDKGDAAVRLWLLPKVPIKLILWQQDEELPAALTILFDASIEHLLPPDAIWAIVRLLEERLLALANR